MQAKVYKSTGSWYTVKSGDGSFLKARIKGKFKIDGITSTNPIAVGDIVNVEPDDLEETVMITEIFERENYINRVSPHNRNQHHIVAANLDQTLLFATLRSPKTSTGFMDRFLVTAEAYHVPAIIVINKADLLQPKDEEQLMHLAQVYSSVGYRLMSMSMETGDGYKAVEQLLKNKVTLLSGHSGVGKSSFINAILPAADIKTQLVSDWSGKGQHTTTFAEMHDLPGGGQVIDTPGIKEMGIADIDKYELAQYFPEMRAVMHACRFNNCMHVNEPGCAVKEAVNEGTIDTDRYVSYLTIKESLAEKGY